MSATLDAATESRRQFRRMVMLSAALHVGLSVVAMVSFPNLWPDAEPPAGPVITMITPAELAARSAVVAPKPKPPKVETKPEPQPEPVVAPPPPPPVEQIIIPEDTHRKPTPPKRKPEVQQEPEPAPKPREPEPEQQVDLEQWLAQEKAKEAQPSLIDQAADAAETAQQRALPVPGAGGTGAPDPPEVAAWKQKVRAHVRRTLNLPPGFRGKGLKTQVTVTLTSSGDLLGFEVERGSGNPWYDDQIERYLTEEDALPAPPHAGDWALIFDGDL